jgi:hypothetical protein
VDIVEVECVPNHLEYMLIAFFGSSTSNVCSKLCSRDMGSEKLPLTYTLELAISEAMGRFGDEFGGWCDDGVVVSSVLVMR